MKSVVSFNMFKYDFFLIAMGCNSESKKLELRSGIFLCIFVSLYFWYAGLFKLKNELFKKSKM